MGNWHCVPSGCATVVYQEYLPPVVRWRYESEDWQEVEGDDYVLNSDQPINNFQARESRALFVQVKVVGDLEWSGTIIARNGDLIWMRYGANEDVLTPLWKVNLLYGSNNYANAEPTDTGVFGSGQCYKRPGIPIGLQYLHYYSVNGITYNTTFYAKRNEASGYDSNARRYFFGINAAVGILNYRLDPYNFRIPPPCTDNIPRTCTFTITKNGAIVHQETRAVCPEVEKLPCRLDEKTKSIRINKFLYLERVEVVPYGYRNFGGGVYQAIIPNECLNIYNNLTTTIIPQFEGFPTPTNASEATYDFIAQICSAPGCPPPEYQVICDCDCRNCPDGTCPVECGDHICCYDTATGISVESIAIADYCGDAV